MTMAIMILALVALAVIGVWIYKKAEKSPTIDRMLNEDKTPTKAVVDARAALNAVDTQAKKAEREAKRLADAASSANEFLVKTGQRKGEPEEAGTGTDEEKK